MKKGKQRENISQYQAPKNYILGNKFTIAMVEEAIDFCLPGTVFVSKITNTTVFPLEYGPDKSVK